MSDVTELKNVLVFPGGTEVGLEIRSSLVDRREVRLFSAGAGGSSHAPFAFQSHDLVPDLRDESWFEVLRSVIQARGIHYVFGAHEDVLLELARRRDDLGCTLVAPPTQTIELVRSKLLTYAALAGVVDTPRLYDESDPDLPFPLFIKPDRGAGSRGASVVGNLEDLRIVMSGDEAMVLSEYLPGVELTVDCLSDRERGLVFAGPRVRHRMRAGISMDTAPYDSPDVVSMAEAIGGALEMRGAWFFQVRQSTEGSWKLLEVGARVGGSMAITRARGVNLPWMSILEEERKPLGVLVGEFSLQVDRALRNRYAHDITYSTVYVDLDDTLIIHGKVNVLLVAFLHQAVNHRKRVVLLTRHAGDLQETLALHRIAGLADEVKHLCNGESKADFITDRSAIFIDDSFGERVQVWEATGIPVFDVTAVEALLDDRA